ncbi:MAG: DUF308 domain-containing protein [Sphingobacteriaceae bacterium]|nr:DUF308 domain-containing protein [Sphingobacteriaceae bacterium]
MKHRSFNIIGYETKYWWFLLANGLLFIILGGWIILSPEKSYFFLSQLLAIGMLATGFFEAIFSLFHINKIRDWQWIFAGGLIDVMLGTYVFNFPILTMIIMPAVIGIWMLIRGFMTISGSLTIKALGIRDWVWLLFTSMLLIFPSLVILIDPFVVLVNFVKLTGVAFILSGLFRIYFSQQLRRLKTVHRQLKKRKKHLDYDHHFG